MNLSFEVLTNYHTSKIGNIARAIAFGFVALKINIPLKLSKEVLKLLVK